MKTGCYPLLWPALLSLLLWSGQTLADCRWRGQDDNWISQYQACPQSALAAYNAVQHYLQRGDLQQARKLLQESVRRHSDFAPLRQLQQRLRDYSERPYALVAEHTDKRLKQWLAAYRPPTFTRTPPNKPQMPALPELVKGEFETTPAFKTRVEKARSDRRQRIERIEQDYKGAVEAYNLAVLAHNQDVEQGWAERKAQLPAKRQEFLHQAIGEVFGPPRFKEAQYDADKQRFSARLVSGMGNFDQNVSIQVPLSEGRAQRFKGDLVRVEPEVRFKISEGTLRIDSIHAVHGSDRYRAALSAKTNPVRQVVVRLDDQALPDLDRLSTLAVEHQDTQLLAHNEAFFDTALSLEQDPQLAKLRQRQAELQRQQQEADRAAERERERQRLKAQIASQEQKLASLGGQAGTDYKCQRPTTSWRFKPVGKAQRGNETLAVIIGNRNYRKGIPPVHCAYNDAKAMRQFAEQALGVSPENLLYEQDATKGTLEGLFESTLPNRVNPGKTDVLVYFSGHGMVADRDAMLLPVDARPSTAAHTGYSRNQILRQLGVLKARSVILVLDACYTGTSKDGRTLVAGKPVFYAPRSAQIPANITLISASSGKQIAWVDEKRGHSLLTYYLLKGFQGAADANTDRQVDQRELADYLTREVDRAARRLHEQRQQPQVRGRDRVLLSYR
ncbi:MAG: hypothetical protein GY807_00150 [Gammaproteobacteria bacterium]|nr:hypothetical protein [Gammaproteobacteria bacterium]